jgi:hypothetical protein
MNDFNLKVEIRDFTPDSRQGRYGWFISIQEPQEPGPREYLSKYDDCTSNPIDAWDAALGFIELLKAEGKFLPAAGMQTMGYKPPPRPPAQRTEGTGRR